MHFALIDGANLSHNRTLSPDAMVALNALDNDNFIAFSVPLGIMLFGAAGSVLKGAALPKWMAWVAIVLGICFFTPVGFFRLRPHGHLDHRHQHPDVPARSRARPDRVVMAQPGASPKAPG